MDIIDAIILGVVQGVTEFIPISSSGHLVLVPHFLHIEPPGVAFDAYLHLGTLLALFAFYWRDIENLLIAFGKSIMDIAKRNLQTVWKSPDKKMAWLIIISSIPTAAMGFLLEDYFDSLFENPLGVGFLLIVTGCFLWIGRNKGGEKDILRMGITTALLIGVAQGCAIAPGISRSGATIVMGLLLGLTRDFAARYAFLLCIPSILGVTILKLNDVLYGEIDPCMVIFGTIISAISGYIAIKVLLRIVSRGKLGIFAYYCWVVGFLVVVLIGILHRSK
ncbi:MAG: undecaprenyl-diphosphate phosphatase [bacterium]|nr:undecaprenyl-diphosphate phosphatase [bacterium]